MRRTLVLIHRWAGLFMAVFLFIAGLTGAIISWDHELDEALNPQLFEAAQPSGATPRPALELASEVERRDPRLRAQFVPLNAEPGHALLLSVSPKVDPKTNELYELGFNQVSVNPYTGEIQGRREWGDISLSRENVLPFLYKLHYSMHIPDGFGLETGVLFMGIVGIVWTLDCFIALWISFPNRKTWRKSFAFRFRAGGQRLNFDLHRSGAVWAWAVLLVLAVTSVSMNLGSELVRPAVSMFSTLTNQPFDTREATPLHQPITPILTRERALELGRAEGQRRGLPHPAGGVFYSPNYGVYGVGFFDPANDHGDGTLGNAWVYVDALDGSQAGAWVPGQGSAGDIFMQAQFPLHSGRLFGLPGRIFVSGLGLVVAMLSVTGVIIWARKRRTRTAGAREVASPMGAGTQASA
jgi:uncharacterized iron-regulated membrane protein